MLRFFEVRNPSELFRRRMTKALFGTDGIRGIPGTPPLDDATLYATGRAVAAFLHRDHSEPHAMIGMDTRESGPHISAMLAAGLEKGGAKVSFAGILTTPGVACLVRQNDYHAGVVVSASHNPYHDNGVKLFSHEGMKFPDAVEEELEADIFKHASEKAPGSLPRVEADESLHTEYLEFLRNRIIPGAKLAGMRIVLDCANGAAYRLGPELFSSLGVEVVAMNVAPNGRNINDGCGSLHLEGLQKRVVAERAAFGLAFDGDADRALFVSSNGAIVNGDAVLLIAARYLRSLDKLPGNRVVATTMSNLSLERALAREGISLTRANVGDRYVLEEMLSNGAVLGGEQSGHIIFLDDSPAGDGLLTAIKVASLVALHGGLESLLSGMKDYPQTIVNVKVKSKRPHESIREVAQALAEAKATLGENGRIVLRYSGTEPLARIMVEAEQNADVEKFSKSIAAAVRASIGA